MSTYLICVSAYPVAFLKNRNVTMRIDKQGIPLDESSEAALIRMLVEGSQLAFRHIYDLYASRLYAFCLQYTKSRNETDEIVQDAFIWLWNHRTELRQRNSLKALLFISVRHQLINAWRRNAKAPVYEDFIDYRDRLSGDRATDADFDYAEFLRVVRQQLDKLPQTQRRVIELSRFDNLAVRDIAQTLSLSEQTVKNNLSVGLKTLKKLLAQQSIVLLFLFYVNFV